VSTKFVGRAVFIQSTKGGTTKKRIRAGDAATAKADAAKVLGMDAKPDVKPDVVDIPTPTTTADDAVVDNDDEDNEKNDDKAVEGEQSSMAIDNDIDQAAQPGVADDAMQVDVPRSPPTMTPSVEEPPEADEHVDHSTEPVVEQNDDENDNDEQPTTVEDAVATTSVNDETAATATTAAATVKRDDGEESGNAEAEEVVDEAANAEVDALERFVIICQCPLLIIHRFYRY
jgi:hypothetical protein